MTNADSYSPLTFGNKGLVALPLNVFTIFKFVIGISFHLQTSFSPAFIVFLIDVDWVDTFLAC